MVIGRTVVAVSTAAASEKISRLRLMPALEGLSCSFLPSSLTSMAIVVPRPKKSDGGRAADQATSSVDASVVEARKCPQIGS